MKFKKWRLLGAIAAAMLIAVAGSTFGKGNAPNATANAPDTAIAQDTTGTSTEVVNQGDIVIATLYPATRTEGGALAGTELVAVNASLGGKESLIIAINNSDAGINKCDYKATFTKGVRGDAIFHLTAAAKIIVNSLADGATLCEEAYDVIYEIAAATTANLTG